MRHILPTALALALYFSGCSAKPSQPTSPTLQKGWRPVGLVMTTQEINYGGVGKVATSDPYVLAIAGYGKLYLGKEGDSTWDSVPSPENEPASAIYGDQRGFLCGLMNTGRVFSLDPATRLWTDLGLPRQDSMRVMVIQRWQAGYVASLRNHPMDSANPILAFSTTPGAHHSMTPNWNDRLYVTALMDLDTVLLAAISDSGIYRYTAGAPVWRKLPAAYTVDGAASGDTVEIRKPLSFAFLKGRIWVGQFLRGLYSTPSLDAAIQPYVPPDSLKGAIPVVPMALLAWRNRLFIGGSDPFQPLVLDPATNRLQTLSVNFCMDAQGRNQVCQGFSTWGLAATADTLYTASGGLLLKIGYQDIPQ